MANNVNNSNNIVDYYAIYQLDRNMSREDILKRLRQLQGEIRSKMSCGSLNSPEILEKLQESFNGIAQAVKTFKTDERRQEYDAALSAAYQAGRVNMEAQKLAQSLYEEIETLFLNGQYHIAIRKCLDALNNNVTYYKFYIILARSYLALNDINNSIGCIENGIKIHPNNLEVLKAGARIANEGASDFNRSQQYVNKMTEIDSDSPLTVSEQTYLYVTNGKTDMAYQLIDDYLNKHPNDNGFRELCAHDLVGYSYSCYTKDPESNSYVIASKEDYQKCLDICNKAASIYQDENVRTALENAKYFGNIEFNDENNKNILWLFIGGGLYAFGGLMMLLTGIGSGSAAGFFGILIPLLLMGGLGGLCIYSGIKLKQCSYRPYWQINKFILTGEREPEEKKYVMIGKIFAGYMEWSLKLSWKLTKFCFRLAFKFALG